jgi:hypothetical protein
MPIASLRYRGNYSHRIRRKTAAPDATFFIFLFHLFPISPFYHKCNPSPPLENYKRGGRGHAHEEKKRRIEHTTNTEMTHTHLAKTTTHTSLEETWDPLPLSKACNPYYEHYGARQYEQQQNPLDVGLFSPEPVYTLVSALHTIQA